MEINESMEVVTGVYSWNKHRLLHLGAWHNRSSFKKACGLPNANLKDRCFFGLQCVFSCFCHMWWSYVDHLAATKTLDADRWLQPIT